MPLVQFEPILLQRPILRPSLRWTSKNSMRMTLAHYQMKKNIASFEMGNGSWHLKLKICDAVCVGAVLGAVKF